MKLAETLRAKSAAVGIKLVVDVENIKDLNTEQLVAKQVEQMESVRLQ